MDVLHSHKYRCRIVLNTYSRRTRTIFGVSTLCGLVYNISEDKYDKFAI